MMLYGDYTTLERKKARIILSSMLELLTIVWVGCMITAVRQFLSMEEIKMKKWNEAEIVELNIAETAGLFDDIKDAWDTATGKINWGDGIQDPNAVGETIEQFFKDIFGGEGDGSDFTS